MLDEQQQTTKVATDAEVNRTPFRGQF